MFPCVDVCVFVSSVMCVLFGLVRVLLFCFPCIGFVCLFGVIVCCVCLLFVFGNFPMCLFRNVCCVLFSFVFGHVPPVFVFVWFKCVLSL